MKSNHDTTNTNSTLLEVTNEKSIK